jgi:hypothetical protein
MRPGRLVLAARRLAAALGEGVGLAGGLAVAAWGEIRATREVDFVTNRGLEDIQAALRNAGIGFVTRLGDPLAGELPWVVSGELEGARFQVFAPRKQIPFKTVDVSPAGDRERAVPVVELGDLIRLKLEAGGVKDLWDVARLLRRHPDQTAFARALARDLGLDGELARWLDRESRTPS